MDILKNPGDVYGKRDINNLLGKYKEIEKNHFKLWLTSVTILQKILHSSTYNQSAAEIEHIRRKVRLYVRNESFFKARKLLRKYHCCVISGIPGIGKTTLAEMLLLWYRAKGYEVVTVHSDISEGIGVWNEDPQTKQVFYYDDFLGQTTFAEKLAKNEDRKILRFMEMVRNNPKRRFILTTREYILNQAKGNYEVLSSSSIDLLKCVIDLSHYTNKDKARILLNHLYFSNLPREVIMLVLQEKKYRNVVKHPNYSPRIIEWMTNKNNFVDLNKRNYAEWFMNNLNNPSEIWKGAFNDHISDESRNLLILLSLLPHEVTIEDLSKAFESLQLHRHELYGFQVKANGFWHALRELENGLITIEKGDNTSVVSFGNPSLKDFVMSFLNENTNHLVEVINSAVFFDQCMQLWYLSMSGYVLRKDESFLHYSEFTKTVSANASLLLQSMQRTFYSKGCRVVKTMYETAGQPPRVTYDASDDSVESRIYTILWFIESQKPSNGKQVLDPLMAALAKSVSARKPDLSLMNEILRFARRIQATQFELEMNPEELVTIIKSAYFTTMDNLEDFESFVNFLSESRDSISRLELRIVKENFRAYYPKAVSEILQYPFSQPIEDFTGTFKKVAKKLKVGVKAQITELRNRAAEIRDDEYREEEENRKQDQDSKEDADIDSMFKTLLDAI